MSTLTDHLDAMDEEWERGENPCPHNLTAALREIVAELDKADMAARPTHIDSLIRTSDVRRILDRITGRCDDCDAPSLEHVHADWCRHAGSGDE